MKIFVAVKCPVTREGVKRALEQNLSPGTQIITPNIVGNNQIIKGVSALVPDYLVIEIREEPDLEILGCLPSKVKTIAFCDFPDLTMECRKLGANFVGMMDIPLEQLVSLFV